MLNFKMKDRVFYFPSTEYDLYASENKYVVNKTQYSLRKGDMIVVFLSYGKVGSTAVCCSIKRLKNPDDRPVPVYHLHAFAPVLRRHDDVTHLRPHELSGQALHQVYHAHRRLFRWRFINGVRDPISMLVSGYYENKFASDGAPNVAAIRNYSNMFTKWMQSHNDKEYGAHVGVDLYSKRFNHEAGYSIIKKKNVHVLTYRLDRLSDIFSKAMEEFLGTPDLILKNSNKAADKDVVVGDVSYAESYKDMVRKFTMPAELLDPILEHRSVTHFFRPDEIAAFREKWLDKGE